MHADVEHEGGDPQSLAQRCADAMWADDRASQALGIEVTDVGPGRARATMIVTGDMVNGHAIAHGGYVFLLADTAFAFACNTYGVATVARAAEVSFVAAAREGDRLVATAQERHRAGRSGIYDVTVRLAGSGAVDSEAEALAGAVVAEFRGHSVRLTGPPAEGEPTP